MLILIHFFQKSRMKLCKNSIKVQPKAVSEIVKQVQELHVKEASMKNGLIDADLEDLVLPAKKKHERQFLETKPHINGIIFCLSLRFIGSVTSRSPVLVHITHICRVCYLIILYHEPSLCSENKRLFFLHFYWSFWVLIHWVMLLHHKLIPKDQNIGPS